MWVYCTGSDSPPDKNADKDSPPNIVLYDYQNTKAGSCVRDYLNGYQGYLQIDNNRAERAIKPFVIERKSWLFANTANGAQASAMLYSLIETAKANGLKPFHYLNHLLEELPKKLQEIERLLPWNVDLPKQVKR
jgi:hypothetical protein